MWERKKEEKKTRKKITQLCINVTWGRDSPSIMPLLLWGFPTFGVYLARVLHIGDWQSPVVGHGCGKIVLPLVQNKMTVTKMCADYEVSSGIDVGMIFWWHCQSVLSSLNVPNFSFHANKRKNHFFSDQQLSPYKHFIVDQREFL